MIPIIVGGQLFPPNSYLPEDLILVPVSVEDIDRNESEISWHLELEFLPKKWAEIKPIKMVIILPVFENILINIYHK